MLINLLIVLNKFNYYPSKYISIRNTKNYYYQNNLSYDIYNNEKILKNKLLTAEHIVPKSYLKIYKEAKRDMHNIFLTNAETNIYRSNYRYSDKITYKNLEKINLYKYYHPCNFSKGQIARSIAYMKIIYPKINLENIIEPELILKWNFMFQPSILEIKRNVLINSLQGNINPFIEDPMIIYKFL
jgi:endonuclease I